MPTFHMTCTTRNVIFFLPQNKWVVMMSVKRDEQMQCNHFCFITFFKVKMIGAPSPLKRLT